MNRLGERKANDFCISCGHFGRSNRPRGHIEDEVQSRTYVNIRLLTLSIRRSLVFELQARRRTP